MLRLLEAIDTVPINHQSSLSLTGLELKEASFQFMFAVLLFAFKISLLSYLVVVKSYHI